MEQLRDFEVTTGELAPSVATVRVAGDLDLYTAPEVEEAFAALPDGTRHVLADLTELSFVDSAGISALLAAERRLRGAGGSLALLVDDARVLRVLEVTGLDRFLSIHRDRDVAVRQLVDSSALESSRPG